MASKITAYGDKIVAKKIELDTKTASGFLLPDSAKEEAKVAEVVAVGPEVKEVKKGDKVFYTNYSSPVKVDGTEYVYMKEEDVYFKVG
ncbi:hypothetical protein A3D14_00290 [Candidatus Saccharibacteria bacterium RIFCSPHIGHO2_02_FULL_47_12]|nr:MAG: hypothetical protein A3D14_00290 [Candidatus Saccharibacteria bacterium RIFCSPHIGHO2_02_FULL_47_12]